MDPRFFRKYADLITEAEQQLTEAELQQLQEGMIDSLKQIYQTVVTKARAIPNFKQYMQMAKPKQKEAVEAIKASKSPQELQQKILQIAGTIQLSEDFNWRKPVAQSVAPAVAGAGASAAMSVFAVWAAKVAGVYASAGAYAAGGQIGMALAGGVVFGVLAQVAWLGVAIALAVKASKSMKANRDNGYTSFGNTPKEKDEPKATPKATPAAQAPAARTTPQATPNFGGNFGGGYKTANYK
jgi:hypothetical protein